MKRRICWPGPSLACLAGECPRCCNYHLRATEQIRRWAQKRGAAWSAAFTKGSGTADG